MTQTGNWCSSTVLQGKVAIVTGGGAGLGKATALALASAGAKLVIADLATERAIEVCHEIRAGGGEALAITTNVASQQDIDNLIAKTCEAFHRIDILANIAGISLPRASTLDVMRKDWDKMMEINMSSLFFLSQAAARVMAKNGGGRIVNMASLRGTNALPGIVPYCTAKGAVMAMTRALAVDLAPHNINVNAVAPGYVPTDMVAGLLADQEKTSFIIERTPLRKMGTPEEMAAAVLYFCIPQSSYTTGHTLVLDGGWSVY